MCLIVSLLTDCSQRAPSRIRHGEIPFLHPDRSGRWFFLVTTAIVIGTQYAGARRANADFIQTNLVSDIQGLATITDPLLINPWGISHSATSPFWTSNQGTSTATLYAVTANNNVTQVTAVNANGFVSIPPGVVGAVGSTGQVNTWTSPRYPLTPDD